MADDVVPYVSVAGLRVPATLVPRIVAAFRGTYPDVTADHDEEEAVRQVLKYLVEVIVTTHESKAASTPVMAAADEMVAEAQERGRKAREAALAAVGTIVTAATALEPTDLTLGDFTGLVPAARTAS